MRMSRDHILTSQAGSLPRPDDLIKANGARESGETSDETVYQETLKAAVVDVVRRQKEIGIDVPGDGEFGKSMGHKVNYRAWWSYCFNRLGGLDLAGPGLYDGRRSAPNRAKSCSPALPTGATAPNSWRSTRIRKAAFTPGRRWPNGRSAPARSSTKATTRSNPTSRTSRPALKANGVEEGFMTSVAPASASRLRTSTTRPTKNSCTPSARPCARNTRPSSMPD